MVALFDKLSTTLNEVHWHGRYFSAQCPFHDDTEPSLLVYPDGAYCLGERRRYGLAQIERKVGGQKPTNTTAHKTFDWRHAPDPETIADDGFRAIRRQPSLADYLVRRGLHRTYIHETMLGWWEGWYTFPIYGADANFRGLVIRASPAIEEKTKVRYLTPPGQPEMLYTPDWTLWTSLMKLTDLLVVYGIFDCLLLNQLGLSAVTSTLGQKLSSHLLSPLRCSLTVIPDNHPHEIQSAQKLASELGWRGRVKLLDYPIGVKDPAGFWPGRVKELTCQISSKSSTL